MAGNAMSLFDVSFYLLWVGKSIFYRKVRAINLEGPLYAIGFYNIIKTTRLTDIFPTFLTVATGQDLKILWDQTISRLYAREFSGG